MDRSSPNRVRRLKMVLPYYLTNDLRRSPWKGNENQLAGHCYVASEAAWHILGGKDSGFVPCTVRHEGSVHWFLRREAEVLDLTAGQFQTLPPYELGRGRGFLTREPSKRCKALLRRMELGVLRVQKD